VSDSDGAEAAPNAHPSETSYARQPASANTRPAGDSNARQPEKPNTRQPEKPNTRQPVQITAKAEEKPISPNARQAVDLHLNNGQNMTADEYMKSSVDMHMKQAPDVHTNRSDSNTRQTLDAGAAFNYEAQLFRLETYRDKYGRTICKRVVRFVRNRAGRNVGEVTPELAEALSRRPGKGRTAEARAEAERNRLLAESLAKRLRGAKASGRRASARKNRSGRQSRNRADAFGSELLPDVSDFPRNEGSAYVH
jgi:hypothetical protein